MAKLPSRSGVSDVEHLGPQLGVDSVVVVPGIVVVGVAVLAVFALLPHS